MNSPLSIAIACYPTLGGSGIIAADIAAGIAQRGHQVHVVASALPGRMLPQCSNLIFHEVRVPDYPLFEHPPYAIAMAATLVEIATARHLDIIHAHYAIPHAASAYLARQVLGLRAPKIITTLHGTDVTQLGGDPSYRSITRFTLEASDCVTVPSQFLREETYRQIGLPRTCSIDVIGNFVDTERFFPAARRDAHHFDPLFANAGEHGSPVLFHVSNFRAVKRVTDLLEILHRVRRQRPARMVVVGDGPERTQALRRAEALDLTGAVAFLGKRTEFAQDLSHADAFLLPSASESFGVAALEALSSGVPVFAYRIGGLPEVVSDDCGVLAPPFDTDALADALCRMLGDPQRHQQMSTAARERAVEHFSSAPALDSYEKLYERLHEESQESLGPAERE